MTRQHRRNRGWPGRLVGFVWLVGLAVVPRASTAAGPVAPDDLYPQRRGDTVVFAVAAPPTATVALVGDFNDWRRDATPMEYVGDGIWEAAVTLSPGEHEYAFVIDGVWHLDPSNPDETTAADGRHRSRIKVLYNGQVSQYGRWNEPAPEPHRVTFRPRPDARLIVGGDYSFTRVEGSTLWLKLGYRSSWAYAPRLDVDLGYGWESERTNVRVDLAQPLIASGALRAGVQYVKGTGYENQSGIGWRENTLAALFLKHDFNDYYEIHGVEPYAELELPAHNRVRVSFASEDYDSLTSKTNWSFFEAGSDRFRPNPPLYILGDRNGLGGSGRLEAARLEWVHDSRRARHAGTVGTYVRSFLEFGGGDFAYNRWTSDGRAYLRLGPPVHLAVRGMAAGRFGDDRIPSQKLFYVGGLGTVRGHGFRSLVGDHALVANVEYTLLFGDYDYGLLLFYDTGTAWDSTRQDAADATVLQSIGFGLKSADDDFRLQFAQPVGKVEGQLETTVRLQRTF